MFKRGCRPGGRQQNKITTRTGRYLFWQPQPDCNSHHAWRHGGPLSARKVQTRNACFHQLRARTVPVQIWGADSKIKNDRKGRYLFWQPQPDSNWCSRLERAVSWASRRWGQNCAVKPFNFTWAAVIPAPGPAKIYFRGWFWRERWGQNCR